MPTQAQRQRDWEFLAELKPESGKAAGGVAPGPEGSAADRVFLASLSPSASFGSGNSRQSPVGRVGAEAAFAQPGSGASWGWGGAAGPDRGPRDGGGSARSDGGVQSAVYRAPGAGAAPAGGESLQPETDPRTGPAATPAQGRIQLTAYQPAGQDAKARQNRPASPLRSTSAGSSGPKLGPQTPRSTPTAQGPRASGGYPGQTGFPGVNGSQPQAPAATPQEPWFDPFRYVERGKAPLGQWLGEGFRNLVGDAIGGVSQGRERQVEERYWKQGPKVPMARDPAERRRQQQEAEALRRGVEPYWERQVNSYYDQVGKIVARPEYQSLPGLRQQVGMLRDDALRFKGSPNGAAAAAKADALEAEALRREFRQRWEVQQATEKFRATLEPGPLRAAVANGGSLTPFQERALQAISAVKQDYAVHQRQIGSGLVADLAITTVSALGGKLLAGASSGAIRILAEGEGPLARAAQWALRQGKVLQKARVFQGPVGQAFRPDGAAVESALVGMLQQPAAYAAIEKDPEVDRLMGEALTGLTGGYLFHGVGKLAGGLLGRLARGGVKLTAAGYRYVRGRVKAARARTVEEVARAMEQGLAELQQQNPAALVGSDTAVGSNKSAAHISGAPQLGAPGAESGQTGVPGGTGSAVTAAPTGKMDAGPAPHTARSTPRQSRERTGRPLYHDPDPKLPEGYIVKQLPQGWQVYSPEGKLVGLPSFNEEEAIREALDIDLFDRGSHRNVYRVPLGGRTLPLLDFLGQVDQNALPKFQNNRFVRALVPEVHRIVDRFVLRGLSQKERAVIADIGLAVSMSHPKHSPRGMFLPRAKDLKGAGDLFIDPFAGFRDEGAVDSAEEWAQDLVLTIIHEIAHLRERNEGSAHRAEIVRIQNALGADEIRDAVRNLTRLATGGKSEDFHADFSAARALFESARQAPPAPQGAGVAGAKPGTGPAQPGRTGRSAGGNDPDQGSGAQSPPFFREVTEFREGRIPADLGARVDDAASPNSLGQVERASASLFGGREATARPSAEFHPGERVVFRTRGGPVKVRRVERRNADGTYQLSNGIARVSAAQLQRWEPQPTARHTPAPQHPVSTGKVQGSSWAPGTAVEYRRPGGGVRRSVIVAVNTDGTYRLRNGIARADPRGMRVLSTEEGAAQRR